jgi:hypothetical protein
MHHSGFSGYNTKWLRVLVPDLFGPDGDDLRSAPPVLVTIFLGTACHCVREVTGPLDGRWV